MTDSTDWYLNKRDWIRREAGHDAAKLKALVLDPALEREARELFPERPLLYLLLKTTMESEILLAEGGVFLVDGPPSDAATAELQRRNREKLARWDESQRLGGGEGATSIEDPETS